MVAPFNKWNKAHEELREHQNTKYHQAAQEKAEQFVASRKQVVPRIVQQLDERASQQIRTNREILSSVVKTVVLCGRQGLALRGNNDDGCYERTT